MRKRVLLFGLEQATASQLEAVMSKGAFESKVLPLTDPAAVRAAIDEFQPVVICTPAGNLEARRILQAAGSHTPFVAVSLDPNPREWLQALQSGASDYFGPPFERQQVGWVLQSAVNGSGMPSVLSLTA